MVQRWLYSTNAKDISIIYFILALFSGVAGTVISLIIRLELAAPGAQYLHGNNQLFNVLVVGHAILIIFFLLMPALIGGFGNILINHNNNNKINNKNDIINSNNKNLYNINNINDNNNNKFNKDKIGSFLAGLIEGDGHIHVPKKDQKYQYAQITITYPLEDIELANYISNLLGIGSVQDRSKFSKHCNWLIGSKKDLIVIINLINGYFRTPKHEALVRLINFINIRYKDVNINIKELDNTPLNSNAWLAGFSDADSSFLIKFTNKQVQLGYVFDIQQSYQRKDETRSGSYFDIINKIAIYFNCRLISYIRFRENYKDKYYYYYNIRVCNINNIKLVIEYFDKYSLLSSKYINYKDWSNLYKFCINQKSFSDPISYNKAKEIR